MIVLDFNLLKESIKGLEKTYKAVSTNVLTKNVGIRIANNKGYLLTFNIEAYQLVNITDCIISEDDGSIIECSIDFKKFSKIIKIGNKDSKLVINKINDLLEFNYKNEDGVWKLITKELVKYPELNLKEDINSSNFYEIKNSEKFVNNLKKIIWLADRSGNDDETYKRMIYFGHNSIQAINGIQGAIRRFKGLLLNESIDRTMVETLLVISKNNTIKNIKKVNNMLIFTLDNKILSCEVKKDRYKIEWNNILTKPTIKYRVDKNEFIKSLTSALLIAEDNDDNDCFLSLDKELLIIAEYDNNRFEQKIPINNISKTPITFNVDLELLIEGIKKCFQKNDKIVIETSHHSPLIIKGKQITYLQTKLK